MRVRSALAAVLLVLGSGYESVALAASADKEKSQEKLAQTLSSLAKSKEEQARLEKKHREIAREMEKLQTRVTSLAGQLQESEKRVSSEEAALGAVTGKLGARQREFEARKADYAATVVTLLRLRRIPVTSLFTSDPDSFATLMRTAAVLEKTNLALAQKAKALRGDMDALRSLRGETTARKARTSTETQTLLKERAALEKALKERQALYAKIESDRERAEQQVATLSRESQSLQELIGKLDEKERAAPPAPQPAAQKPSKTPPAKGKLAAPVAGAVLHRFGDPKNAGESYRGMVVRARSGATVVAPNDGRVVFTGPFRDYGNMVLIKHPGGYISLLAGVGKVSAGLGQNVRKGEPVAVMGEQKDAEAYIELRDSSSKPIDPADWFANVTQKMSR